MKTKTLFVYYLILLLTGIAISGYSQKNTNNKANHPNKNNYSPNDKDIKAENNNNFDNLNMICSLYYSKNRKLAQAR